MQRVVRAVGTWLVVLFLASSCAAQPDIEQNSAIAATGAGESDAGGDVVDVPVSTPTPRPLPTAPALDATAGNGGTEMRPELLALDGLLLEGGGTFDPDSVADKNVLLWFWGPF